MSRRWIIAAVWAGIALAGGLLLAVRLWTLGRLELFAQHAFGAIVFIPLWAIATEVVFVAAERWRIDSVRRAAWYAAGGAAFFVVSNAVVRLPFLFTRGVEAYWRDLVLGLSEFAPAAALAFAVIVFTARWCGAFS